MSAVKSTACSKSGCVKAYTARVEHTGLQPERKFDHKSNYREGKIPTVHILFWF